jgi:hypothetical protein
MLLWLQSADKYALGACMFDYQYPYDGIGLRQPDSPPTTTEEGEGVFDMKRQAPCSE